MSLIAWLARYGHVVAAAIWVGGYAVLALAIVPMMMRDAGSRATLGQLAILTVRLLTFAGVATLAFGVFLIGYARGYASVLGGEWGGIMISAIVLAVALLGIGDGALRPALRRLSETGEGTAARRWAIVGLVVGVLAIGIMTRAVYAGS